MANSTDKQLHAKNLDILKDQLEHEALLNKKFSQYATQCTDNQLKNLCNEACNIHKQNFNNLKTYLDSHQ